MRNILIIIFAFIFVSNLEAICQSVPAGINFKSVIRDANGQPLSNQDVDIKLSIVSFGDNTEMTLSSLTNTYTTNAQGLVCIDFDEELSTGNLSFIPWWEGNLKFRLEVDADASGDFEVMEDIDMYPVPYAHFALFTFDGPDHPMGPTGPNGANGIPGWDGAPGPQGPTGPTGPKGPPGPPGLPAGAGPTGPQGPMNSVSGFGPTGPAGMAGADGPTGPAGPPGMAGAASPTPFPCQGPTGPTGPNDPNWTVVSGNVSLADVNDKMILTAADGSCWELTIVNGNFTTVAATCP